MLNRMGPDGKVIVQRSKYQTLKPCYAQRIITHARGITMALGAFSWHRIGPIAKINEKMDRCQYLE